VGFHLSQATFPDGEPNFWEVGTMRSIIFAVLALLFVVPAVFAVTVSGTILDDESGKPVSNASVVVTTINSAATTDEDGFFTILFVPNGSIELVVSHVGYWSSTSIISSNLASDIVLNLRPKAYRGEEVTLSIDRVERQTATVPFSNISKEELNQRHYGQDLPVALEGLPSMTTTTDAGTGLGYSYLSMRGFDFKRVSVLLNGVMLNDPEDFYVYWVDLADFGASVEDVQVQRGAGSAMLGLPAVGGTIDVQTATYSEKPRISAEYGLGSYNTQRASVHLASGPIQDKYFINTRFSRITSDGYRDQSWSDYFSYYMSAARVDENMTTRLVLFGGPIKNHMAYVGVTRDQLALDREQNPLTYENEIDSYYQPHYQLHNTWDIANNLRLQNTLYYIRGEGYFDVYYPSWWGYGWDFWALNDPGEDIGDMVARQHVENHQGGWQPRLTWTLNNHTLDIGGQFVSHRSRRYGEVTWAAVLPDGTEPNHVWYDYQGRKRTISGYVQDNWQVSRRLNVTGAVQVANVEYGIQDDQFNANEFTQPYTFVMPRIGASYKATDDIRLWTSFSRITREPRLKDHFWGETGYPVIRYDNPATFDDPQIEPETLSDFELGVEYSGHHHFLGLTGYLMNVENEIVDIGEYDVLGQPIIENADETRRYGIELSARTETSFGVFVEGNLNFSKNRFQEYVTHIPVYNDVSGALESKRLNLKDRQIINAPEQILNLSVGYRRSQFDIQLNAHFVGERYVANTENFDFVTDPNASTYSTYSLDRSLDAYTRIDLHATIRIAGPTSNSFITQPGLPQVELSLHVRNLLDEEYNLSGSSDAWGVYVIPAAKRHYFASLKVTL
jgi:iron complex outermembrane recepter protein